MRAAWLKRVGADGAASHAVHGAFVVACLCAALPLWLVPLPPLQDVPQHLAAIRVLHSLDDPSYGMARWLQLHLFRTQYLAYYLAGDGLSYLFGVELANKLLMSASVVATPMAAGALAEALGRDRRVGLLALPLAYNAHLILGFLNFVAALPLCLYGLSVAVRHARQPRRATGAVLAVLCVVCFYMHVVPFAFLGLGAGLCALHREPKQLWARAWPLWPAALGVVPWIARSPAGQATWRAAGAGEGPPVRISRWNTEAAVAQLPDWLTDVLHGPSDRQLLWATLGATVVWGAFGLWHRWRRGAAADPLDDGPAAAPVAAPPVLRLLPLPVLAVGCYFIAPTGYDWIWPIAPRFALIAWLLALPLLPLPGRRTLHALSLVAWLLGGAHLWLTGRAFVDFSRDEVGRFDAALAAIPPGQRVAGLIFDRGSRHVRFSPFLHYVALYQARRGGAVMFSFADFPQSPFSFRGEDRPPRVPPRWEWMPQRVDPARDLGWYDYVLVRGGPGRIRRQRRHYVEVHRDRHWSVWRRLRPAPAAR